MKTKIQFKSALFILLISQLSIVSCEKEENNGDQDNENLPEISDYKIVSTGQETFYNEQSEISAPTLDNEFYGQDASYTGNTPIYIK